MDSGTVDGATSEKRRLAAELRRALELLAMTRRPAASLSGAADVARALADALEELPARDMTANTSSGALLPPDFAEHSPVSGRSNPIAPPVVLCILSGKDGLCIRGLTTFSAAYEGPSGHVHGGFIAAMFDELLGFAQFGAGVTGRLSIRYIRPIPLNASLQLDALVEQAAGRKQLVTGTCRDASGTLLAEAEALFISVR
jgi:hypothetical protein